MLLGLWHQVTDSDAFRRFAKQGPGRALFRSRAFREADIARNQVRSRVAARRHPGMFDDVRTFCFFIGHNKSGASLLSGALDAHRNVILSDEVDALGYVEAGFGRDQILHMIRKGAESEARKGRVTARRLEPYSYAVPGSWQGRSEAPLVVGDSTTGTSTRRIGARPELLDRVAEVMAGVDVKLIHVIRNPFDPISVMMVRGKRSFRNSIDHYFTSCDIVAEIRHRVGSEGLFPVRYEDHVADPRTSLASLCAFLGVTAPREYLDACGAVIRSTPDRSRARVEWTGPWIDLVHERIAAYDFLRGYRFED